MKRLLLAAALLLSACDSHPEQVATVAPPERLVAYEHWVPDTLTDHLLVADVETGFAREIAEGFRGEARWSPDGTMLAVDRIKATQTRDCDECTDVVLFRPDGTEVRTLASQGSASIRAWSPDGRHLAYSTITSPLADDESLHVVGLSGHGDRVLALPDGQEGTVSWSPDGKRILVGTLSDGVWVVDAGGSHPRHITSADVYGDRTRPEKRIRQDGEPIWAADSRHVVLSRDTGTIEHPNVDLYLIDSEHPHDLRALGLAHLHPDSPLLSPDGRLLAFEGDLAGVDCSMAVYVASADGALPRRLSSGQAVAVFGMSWSSDSRTLAYTGPPDGAGCGDPADEQAVHVVDVATGSVRQVPALYSAWTTSFARLQPVPGASKQRG